MTFDVRACGARIRELRMKNGLTQETLAEDLNITDVHLRRIESGVRGGSIELLIELADYFHVSLDYLILGRGGRTDEAKEELNRIRERVEHIIQLLWVQAEAYMISGEQNLTGSVFSASLALRRKAES